MLPWLALFSGFSTTGRLCFEIEGGGDFSTKPGLRVCWAVELFRSQLFFMSSRWSGPGLLSEVARHHYHRNSSPSSFLTLNLWRSSFSLIRHGFKCNSLWGWEFKEKKRRLKMEITVPIKMLQKKKHIQLHIYVVFHRVDKDFPLSRPWSPDTNGATCRLDIVDLIPEQFSLSVMEEWGSPDHLTWPPR